MWPVPTRGLALVLVLAALLVLVVPIEATPWLGALVIVGAVGAVALVDYLLTPSARSVDVERHFPPSLELGAEVPLRWTVANPLGRAVHVGVADSLAPSLGAQQRRFELDLPPSSRAEVTTKAEPERRGRFELDEVVVRVRGPLRLMARQAGRSMPASLRVMMPFRSKREAELRLRRAQLLDIGLRSVKTRGGGTDFDQLREYSVDDEFRRLDWAATARVGRPIVRTYRAERNQTVINVLDHGRVMAARVEGITRYEHAADSVLALTTVATRLGDKCGLVAFERQTTTIVPPARSAQQLRLVTDATNELEPVLFESDYEGAFVEVAARFKRRALLVVHTDLVEQAVDETLLPALPVLARRHLVIVSAIADPLVLRWAQQEPTDADEAYRTAAAIDGLEQRRRTKARLQAFGVTVLDSVPGKQAAALADAYLTLKASGRL